MARSPIATAVLGLALSGVAACGGSSKPAAPSSSSAAPSTSSSSAPSTTVDPNAGRGLTGIVTRVAGDGTDSGKGIPGPAANAGLGQKLHFAVASNGDIFLTRASVDVLKLSGGQLSVFAQLDAANPATGGIVIGPDGSLYVATPGNVFKLAIDGTTTLVLSAKTAGLATSLEALAIDAVGNLYVVDGTPGITRITLDGSTTDGSTTHVAGITGQAKSNTAPGDGGPADKAALGAVTQLAFDGRGNLLIADSVTRRIRQIAPDGTISTIAGGGTTKLAANTAQFVPDGTKATDLELSEVTGVAVDGKGRVYVSDAGAEVIFRFVPGAGIEFVAGNQKGSSETPGLPANQTRVRNPGNLTFDAQGNLFFIDTLVIQRLAGAGT